LRHGLNAVPVETNRSSINPFSIVRLRTLGHWKGGVIRLVRRFRTLAGASS
jgi:hypothetical protein